MRQLKNKLLLFTVIALAACNSDSSKTGNKTDKVTDLTVTTKSADAKASVQEGLTYSDEGNFQKASVSFTKAIQQDSNLAIAYILRANVANSPKEFADYLAKAKAHLDGAGDWEKMYYDYYATFLNNDYNQRLDIAQKMADKFPDAARAHFDLGFTYQGGNQFDKSREQFNKAIELNPTWVGGYNALVNSYLFNDPKDFKKAEENALKVVQLAPKSAEAEIALGDVYRAQNDMQKASDAYTKAIALDPQGSAGYYKRGHTYSFAGKYDEARKDYTQGGNYDSVKTNPMFNIANTYVYAGDTKMANEYLMQTAEKEDASNESADKKIATKLNCLNDCALIAFHTGDAAMLSKLVAMIQPLSDAQGNEVGTNEAKLTEKSNQQYWQALTAAVAGKYDEAKKIAEEMKTTLDPIKDPTKLQGYEFIQGYISMKQKNYPDAISHFEKSNPADMYNKYMLAMSNEMAGNKDKAGQLYKELAVYNFNDLGYALIRAEAVKKAGM